MKLPAVIIATTLLTLLPASAEHLYQNQREFEDRISNYRIVLSGDWQPRSFTDAFGRKKTEFVFRNREEGLLTIVRQPTGARSLSDKVRADLNDLKNVCSCVYSTEAKFDVGPVQGLRISLYYTEAGRSVAGTFYYFKDGDVIWTLRFVAKPESSAIRHELTDKIASSFCPVCPI